MREMVATWLIDRLMPGTWRRSVEPGLKPSFRSHGVTFTGAEPTAVGKAPGGK